jgi:uncharacterized Fe-S center protein
MASKVVFVPFEDGASEEVVRKAIVRAFGAADLASAVPAGRPVAVKTHFGEQGNGTYLPPSCVKAVVDEVREAGGKPCLVETSTLYRGQRHNALDHFNLAVDHGFGPEQMGCPLLFLDGLMGHRHVEVEVGLKHCKTVAVAADLVHMPGAVIVTHLTGHLLAGLGGAIKNVAMGLCSRAGKLRQHSDGQPHIHEAACIACGTCARWCPEDAITVTDAASIDADKCVGCGECVAVCPVGAVEFSWSARPEVFNEKMAEYAYGSLMDKLDSVGFVTVMHRMSKDCNCMGGEDEIVSADLGVLASRDAVAIDQAAADIVNEAHGSDLFEELWPDKHYTAQFEHGQAIGLGSRDYELVRL